MKKFNIKNDIFIKNNDSNLINYYYLLGILIIFVIFNTFSYGIYNVISNNANFLLVFRPLFNVFISCFICITLEYLLYYIKDKRVSITYLFRNRRCAVEGFLLSIILPSTIPIYILIIGSVVVSLIKFISDYYKKYYVNYIGIGLLITSIFMYLDDFSFNYFINNSFFIVYVSLLIVSFLYLSKKGIIKARVIISILLSMFLFIFITFLFGNLNIYFLKETFLNSNLLFIIVFIFGNTIFSPTEKIFQLISGNIMGIVFALFNYFEVNLFFISIAIIVFNLLSSFFNYLSIKLYNNQLVKKIILIFSYFLIFIIAIIIGLSYF